MLSSPTRALGGGLGQEPVPLYGGGNWHFRAFRPKSHILPTRVEQKPMSFAKKPWSFRSISEPLNTGCRLASLSFQFTPLASPFSTEGLVTVLVQNSGASCKCTTSPATPHLRNTTPSLPFGFPSLPTSNHLRCREPALERLTYPPSFFYPSP